MGVRTTPENFNHTDFSAHDIRSIRKRLDLTAQELATLLGVSITTVSRWETGKCKPSKLAAMRLTTTNKSRR